MWTKRLLPAACLWLAATGIAVGDCWDKAAQRYNIPVRVLYAVAKTESNLDPKAYEKGVGFESIGLMQVNSFWFPKLKKFGITREDLWNPCQNLLAGSWILAQEIKRYGLNWVAIGAYNSGAYDARTRQAKLRQYVIYANTVYRHLPKLD